MTNEEWKALLAQLFPAEINGIRRPDDTMPADLGFGLDLPEWIRMDPLRYDLINAVLRRFLSNDNALKLLIDAIQEQLASCDLRVVTEALKGLMSPEMLKKLNGIEERANAYTHPNSGAAGTYKSVSVNAQGHVTAGTNPTTLAGYGITDAAAKEHGNHVPVLETANNARFLRNDNSWQAITPANIGATAATMGGVVGGSLAQNGWVKFANGLILQWETLVCIAPLTVYYFHIISPLRYLQYIYANVVEFGWSGI